MSFILEETYFDPKVKYKLIIKLTYHKTYYKTYFDME